MRYSFLKSVQFSLQFLVICTFIIQLYYLLQSLIYIKRYKKQLMKFQLLCCLLYDRLICVFIYSDYIDNATINQTTDTFSSDDIFLSNISHQCHLTTCAKLLINELIGVVCVNHISSLRVSTRLTHVVASSF